MLELLQWVKASPRASLDHLSVCLTQVVRDTHSGLKHFILRESISSPDLKR